MGDPRARKANQAIFGYVLAMVLFVIALVCSFSGEWAEATFFLVFAHMSGSQADRDLDQAREGLDS